MQRTWWSWAKMVWKGQEFSRECSQRTSECSLVRKSISCTKVQVDWSGEAPCWEAAGLSWDRIYVFKQLERAAQESERAAIMENGEVIWRETPSLKILGEILDCVSKEQRRNILTGIRVRFLIRTGKSGLGDLFSQTKTTDAQVEWSGELPERPERIKKGDPEALIQK